MKVYAVIEKCDDYQYPEYSVVDSRFYSKKEDARKRMYELAKEDIWSEFGICEYEAKE